MSSGNFEFIFNGVEPISLNACESVTRRGIVYKSDAYKHFYNRILPYIISYRKKFKNLAEEFVHGEHALRMTYIWYMPEDRFFTKKKLINKKSGDVDNLVKPINDIIFKELELHNSVIDDALVLDCRSVKRPAEKWSIVLQISLDRPYDHW